MITLQDRIDFMRGTKRFDGLSRIATDSINVVIPRDDSHSISEKEAPSVGPVKNKPGRVRKA